MTEQLYYHDQYQKEWQAEVLSSIVSTHKIRTVKIQNITSAVFYRSVEL